MSVATVFLFFLLRYPIVSFSSLTLSINNELGCEFTNLKAESLHPGQKKWRQTGFTSTLPQKNSQGIIQRTDYACFRRQRYAKRRYTEKEFSYSDGRKILLFGGEIPTPPKNGRSHKEMVFMASV
jgi:hypothetical protein